MKRKSKEIEGHKGILNYPTKQWEITSEDDAENDKDKLKIYEVNSKAWGLLIISLTDIPFGLVKQCDENAQESWKDIIDKYEVSDEKQESLNEATNRWNNCNIKDTSLDPETWFNEIYTLNLRFKNIKSKYDNYEYELKAPVFDVLTEECK